MAKKTEESPEQTTAEPKGARAIHDAWTTLADEAARKIGDLGADALFARLSPEVKERLKKVSGWLDLLKLARVPFKTKGAVSHSIGELYSDFISSLQRLAKFDEEHVSREPQAEKAKKPAVNQVDTTVAVLLAVSGLPAGAAQDFMEWYLTEQENWSGFNRVAVGASVENIRKLAQIPVARRKKLLRVTKERQPLTRAKLRHMIKAEADPTLEVRLNVFLAAINASGEDRSSEFWTAVEKRGLKSFEEFKFAMEMTDVEILKYLDMPSKTLDQRMQGSIKSWNKLDTKMARSFRAGAKSIDRARRRAVRNHFGNEEPIYRRVGRHPWITFSVVLVILAVAITATVLTQTLR